MLVNRNLLKVRLQNEPIPKEEVQTLRKEAAKKWGSRKPKASYFVFAESTSNHAYSKMAPSIQILYKDGTTKDIAQASDQLNISVLSQPVVKYYLCWPRN